MQNPRLVFFLSILLLFYILIILSPPPLSTYKSSKDQLEINDNNFTGTLPQEIGLINAAKIELHNNDFTGLLPSTMGNLTYLGM